MKWIGSVIFVLILVFTSVTVISNNELLEALTEQNRKQNEAIIVLLDSKCSCANLPKPKVRRKR